MPSGPVKKRLCDCEKFETPKKMVTMNVPFLDLKAQLPLISSDIESRFQDIISNTAFILGKYVAEFEKAFAEAQGAKYCIGVSSGTDALHIALLALDIGPDDAVLVPVNTFIATAEAVSLTGATPVFLDHDDHFHIDAGKLEAFLKKARGSYRDKRIRAVIPVHLYGQPADMDAIMGLATEFGLQVVEDCAQSHLADWNGVKTGNFGRFGAFSFYPGKNLGAWGEAGALITNDEQLFHKADCLRRHGEVQRYVHKYVGHNYRMENFQGAVLGVKLRHLQRWTEQRRINASVYDALLADLDEVTTPRNRDKAASVYHLYVIQAEQRDELRQFLEEKGVSTGLHYPIPLHLQEAYRHLGYQKGDFPQAEASCERILSLPMFPELTEGQIRYVCEKIKAFYK